MEGKKPVKEERSIKMKIGFFAILGMIGMLAQELSNAAADGKITLNEGIRILDKICLQLGIDFDKEGYEL